MKLVIPLHSLYWSIHTKDESKRGTAFAFILLRIVAPNDAAVGRRLWRCGMLCWRMRAIAKVLLINDQCGSVRRNGNKLFVLLWLFLRCRVLSDCSKLLGTLVPRPGRGFLASRNMMKTRTAPGKWARTWRRWWQQRPWPRGWRRSVEVRRLKARQVVWSYKFEVTSLGWSNKPSEKFLEKFLAKFRAKSQKFGWSLTSWRKQQCHAHHVLWAVWGGLVCVLFLANFNVVISSTYRSVLALLAKDLE